MQNSPKKNINLKLKNYQRNCEKRFRETFRKLPQK